MSVRFEVRVPTYDDDLSLGEHVAEALPRRGDTFVSNDPRITTDDKTPFVVVVTSVTFEVKTAAYRGAVSCTLDHPRFWRPWITRLYQVLALIIYLGVAYICFGPMPYVSLIVIVFISTFLVGVGIFFVACFALSGPHDADAQIMLLHLGRAITFPVLSVIRIVCWLIWWNDSRRGQNDDSADDKKV
jgi:hypothetical protein